MSVKARFLPDIILCPYKQPIKLLSSASLVINSMQVQGMHLSHPLQYNCNSKISVQPKIKKGIEIICSFCLRILLPPRCLVTYLPQGAGGKKADPNSDVGLFQGCLYRTNHGVCPPRHWKHRNLRLAVDTGSVILSFRTVVSVCFILIFIIIFPQ